MVKNNFNMRNLYKYELKLTHSASLSNTIDVPIRKESLKKCLNAINFLSIKFDINS